MKFTFRQWEIIRKILKEEIYNSNSEKFQTYNEEVREILTKIDKSNLG
jgi:hypothetical protein|nr:MAG TPA: hypothetical protein [Caudoviricetes sp.]